MQTLIQIAETASQTARKLALITTQQKNDFLAHLAQTLRQQPEPILAANASDITQAQAAGMSPALQDRLLLTPARLNAIADDLQTLLTMPDPIGRLLQEKTLPTGLLAKRRAVPLGVLAVIYEARPNVTIDISALAIKSGNAVILRGGKETLATNRALLAHIHASLRDANIPPQAVQFIDDPDRELVNQLVRLDQYIDLLIPRGGTALQDFCKANASMPVMTGGIGICHLFVDQSANQEKALAVIQNAKVQRPSVCNALDTLLVHRDIAAEFLPKLARRLQSDGVQLRCDHQSLQILGRDPKRGILPAEDGDFDQEWLSLTLGIRVVDDLDQAIDHIYMHSTQHSDGILTNEPDNAKRFVNEVDSAAVYINASTRFTDGAQLGLGGEVAVSTQKLHARGPIGLQALTTYKWIIQGDYTVRG